MRGGVEGGDCEDYRDDAGGYLECDGGLGIRGCVQCYYLLIGGLI